MEILGLLLWGIGAVLLVIGGLWTLIETFKSGLLWFIGCMVPFVPLIWLITHWEDGKRPFLTSLAGSGLVIMGNVLKSGV